MQIVKNVIHLIPFIIFGCSPHDATLTSTLNKDSGTITAINQKNSWVFDKIQKQKLIFKNKKVFDTHLFELKYIGQIPMANKAPYLIFSGRDCDECDANISIYVHSPDDGKLVVEMGQNRYEYPGNEKDITSDSLIYQSRAFYGQILNSTVGVIWYEKRLLATNKWDNTVFVIDLSTGKKKDTLLKNKSQIEETLKLLKQSKCKEIKGMDYTSEP